MEIKSLKDGMRNVEVVGMVTELGDQRTVQLKNGGTADVREVTIQDKDGKVKLSLWDSQINVAEKGTKLKVENGYTNSFRNELKLNVGKYGKLSVVK